MKQWCGPSRRVTEGKGEGSISNRWVTICEEYILQHQVLFLGLASSGGSDFKMSFWQKYKIPECQSWRGPQRPPGHAALNFLWVTNPSGTMVKAAHLLPRRKIKHTQTGAWWISYAISGTSQTHQSSPRGPYLRPAPSIFRWTNRTRQEKSVAPEYVWSVRIQAGIRTSQPTLHLHQVRLRTSAVSPHSRAWPLLWDGLLDALTEMLLTEPSSTNQGLWSF